MFHQLRRDMKNGGALFPLLTFLFSLKGSNDLWCTFDYHCFFSPFFITAIVLVFFTRQQMLLFSQYVVGFYTRG